MDCWLNKLSHSTVYLDQKSRDGFGGIIMSDSVLASNGALALLLVMACLFVFLLCRNRCEQL